MQIYTYIAQGVRSCLHQHSSKPGNCPEARTGADVGPYKHLPFPYGGACQWLAITNAGSGHLPTRRIFQMALTTANYPSTDPSVSYKRTKPTLERWKGVGEKEKKKEKRIPPRGHVTRKELSVLHDGHKPVTNKYDIAVSS